MKKIMFNDTYKLTAAVLAGKKTMTRRMIPREFFTLTWDTRDDTLVYENDFGDFIDIRRSKYARYKVGEVIAVGQNYKDAGWQPDVLQQAIVRGVGFVDLPLSQHLGWKNKMFTYPVMMPHRIRITDVRVERLQDISGEDCIKEGVGVSATDNRIGYPFGIPFNYFIGEDKKSCRYTTPREAFATLIDKISGKGTWERNPWVLVYEFELVA